LQVLPASPALFAPKLGPNQFGFTEAGPVFTQVSILHPVCPEVALSTVALNCVVPETLITEFLKQF
jgi:hypothetical protein